MYRKIADDPPPDGVRVLVAWSGVKGPFNPCIGWQFYVTGAGACWTYEPFVSIPFPPDLWCELPLPEQKLIDNTPAK